MRPHADITDSRVVKALAHPLRVRILGLLEDRAASPSELAEQLGAPLGNVSYHVRRLASLGLVRLVKETPRRGAIEHHYEAVARPHVTDEAWREAPRVVKEAMVSAALGQLGAVVNAAASAGGFERAEAHLSRTQLVLDEQGWLAVSRELARVLRDLERIERDSARRLARSDAPEERRSTAVLMLFEDPATPAAVPAPDSGHHKAATRAPAQRAPR